MFAEQLILSEHCVTVLHHAVLAGEMSVPEQRELLLERTRRFDHASQPGLSQPRDLATLNRFLSSHDAAVHGPHGHTVKQWIDPLWRHGIEIDRRSRLTIVLDEMIDGFVKPHVVKLGDFLRRATETGADHQVPSLGVIPLLGCQQLETAGCSGS